MDKVNEELDEINDHRVEEYIPAIVLFITVAVLGVSGNIVSFMYHGFSVSKTTGNIMLTALAIVDFSACLALSGNIVELYRPVKFANVTGCKILALTNHWLATTSGSVVVLVTIDRYRRVCRPFSWQFSLTSAKVTFICTTAFCFLLSSRDIAVINVVQTNITVGSNETVVGLRCTYSDAKDIQAVTIAFLYIDIGMFVILAFVGCILYGLIMRTVAKSRRKVSWYQSHEESTYPARERSSSVYFELSVPAKSKPSSGKVKSDETLNSSKEIVVRLSSEPEVGVENEGFLYETPLQRKNGTTSTVRKDAGMTSEMKDGQKLTINIDDKSTPNKPTQLEEKSPSRNGIQTISSGIYDDALSSKICAENTTLQFSQAYCNDITPSTKIKSVESSQNSDNMHENHANSAEENSDRDFNSLDKRITRSRRMNRSRGFSVRYNKLLMSRNERQISIMFIAVILLAFVSFLPPMLTYLFMNEDSEGLGDNEYSSGIQIALLSYKFHNAINPYIICLFQRKFRRYIKRQVLKHFYHITSFCCKPS